MPAKNQPKKLRVAAISFLNTAPLMWDFTHPPRQEELSRRYDVEFMLPNVCADRLASGKADIGLVPVAALATNPKLAVLPGIAIASLDEVRSIVLVTRRGVALKDVKSVALDSTSRTSAALVKVIFKKFIGHVPEYREYAPDVAIMLQTSHAALLIGDPALGVREAHDCDGFTCYDLGRFWQQATKLPFVYAVWAARPNAIKKIDRDILLKDFQHSRDSGLENLDTLAKERVATTDFPAATIREYWTKNIHYSLDESCMKGLELFFKLAAECDALPALSEMTTL